MDIVTAKHPLDYKNSMNTVLQQEIIRYNNLLGVISSSLKELVNAINGLTVMSEKLELMYKSILIG